MPAACLPSGELLSGPVPAAAAAAAGLGRASADRLLLPVAVPAPSAGAPPLTVLLEPLGSVLLVPAAVSPSNEGSSCCCCCSPPGSGCLSSRHACSAASAAAAAAAAEPGLPCWFCVARRAASSTCTCTAGHMASGRGFVQIRHTEQAVVQASLLTHACVRQNNQSCN
jgi:hypothetical protein